MPTEPKDAVYDKPTYWTHGIGDLTGPVAMGRMAQLVDFDPRLTETSRIVYRFLINWYHRQHGDALMSQRHVARVMKDRAPAGAECPSRSAVGRAIITLLETGWVARTYKGRGRNRSASRYVPVFNVLELAEAGVFPEAAQQVGQFIETENRPTKWATSEETGPVERAGSAKTGPSSGPRTLIQDPVTLEPGTCSDISSAPVAAAPSGGAPADGFDRIAAAYAKTGDDLRKARIAFDDLTPDAAEVERMAAAAKSWKLTATGPRMSLARWLSEKRWLASSDFANDNRRTHRWPSCIVTKIRPLTDREGFFDGAKVWFRDRDGTEQFREWRTREFRDFQTQCEHDRPVVNDPSDDLHEFIGVRFQILENGEPGFYARAATGDAA